MGECVECGVGKLSICPNECFVNGSWVMAWRCFEQNTIGGGKRKRPKKRIKETFKETTTFMFLDYLRPITTIYQAQLCGKMAGYSM